jgi:uncharacterized phage protein (TIGR02220 family)
MSKKLHWFPFYYLDWLSDSEVAMMTYSEKGLFIDMLARCFNEGGLPADNNKLLRLFKCDESDLLECVKMFYIKDEKLFNKKLDSIQKDQRKVSTGRSKAGKASAEARKAKRLMKGTNVEQMLNCVATKAQQNPTNRVQQNTVKKSIEKEPCKHSENIKEILTYLNNKLGSKFRTANGLKARLTEGFSVDDAKKVIDIKFAEWIADEKMRQYLRPDTLFGTKFDSYLNQESQVQQTKAFNPIDLLN